MLAARAASASVSVDARLCARGRRDGRTRVDARRAVGRDGARGALETITRRLGEACLSDARCAVVLRAESGGGGTTPPAPDDMTCRACGTDRNVRSYIANSGKYYWRRAHTHMCVKCHEAHVGAMTPEAREEFDKQCAEETGRRKSKALMERRGPTPPAPEGMTCRACGTDRCVRRYRADRGKYCWERPHTRMCVKCHEVHLDAMTPEAREEFDKQCAEAAGRRKSKAWMERREPTPPAPEGMTCRACGTDRCVRRYRANLGKYYWIHPHTRMCVKCHKAYLDAMTPRERDEFLHECAEKNRETRTRIIRESCPYG